MKNNRSLVIILVIVLLLIAAGAFYILNDRSTNDSATNETAPPQTETATSETPATGNTQEQAQPTDAPKTAEEEAESTKEGEEQQANLRIPTFDVLRVEPDGTAVIAGTAEPRGLLEVMENDDVLTSSDVGDTGDFVAIIDTPLTPGDHQVYLDVSMPDGRRARSAQTATISIPDGDDGELLAIITEPGQASELVNIPEPSSSGQVAQETQTAAATETQQEDDDQSGQTTLDEVTVETSGSNDNQPAIAATVSIRAVEIEGNTLFIAGSGEVDATVRGYLDDAVLTDSTINTDGNFVIEADVPVSVGLHTIRVDMLADDGSVIARAVVPFDRPPGDQVAAVSTAPANERQQQDNGTATFVQPQLQGSDNAVIIRRGDNLWRISRRVYGRGVRYTTIYLANESQIVNPDIILPGQVFSLPKEPLPIGEAEQLHRRLLEGMPVGPEYHLPEGD